MVLEALDRRTLTRYLSFTGDRSAVLLLEGGAWTKREDLHCAAITVKLNPEARSGIFSISNARNCMTRGRRENGRERERVIELPPVNQVKSKRDGRAPQLVD